MFIYLCLEYENYGYEFNLIKYLIYLYYAYKNKNILITNEVFKKYKENFINNGAYENRLCEYYEYKILNDNEVKEVKQYFIKDSIFEDLEKNKGSKLESILYLLKNRYQPLEEEFENIINNIKKYYDEEIECIVYFGNVPLSIKYLAKKYHIPMIANEVGPIRKPNYRCMTGYVCMEELFDTNEIKKRYNKFKEELNSKKDINLFENEEILAIFLEEENLKYIKEINIKPKYEIGIAGRWTLVASYFNKSKYMDYELISDIKKFYDDSQIKFKPHPTDSYESYYRFKNIDNSNNIIEFILNCKRVAAISSNVLFETMLWNRINMS